RAVSSLLRSFLVSPPPLLLLSIFNNPASTYIYPLSLHDALPISIPAPTSGLCAMSTSGSAWAAVWLWWARTAPARLPSSSFCVRSEEHTSELQSRFDLVCRLLLEKKNTHILTVNCTIMVTQHGDR